MKPALRLFIVDRAGAHSIWTLMNAISAEAVAAGHAVVHVVFDSGDAGPTPEAPAGVRVVRLRLPSGRSRLARLRHGLAFAWHFAQLVRRERPDVVHTNFADPGIVARVVARVLGVPRIVSTHHELRGSLNRAYRVGLAATAWTAHRQVYVSRTSAASFDRPEAPVVASPDAVPRDRHLVVRNGFDFRPPEGRAGAGASESAPLLVCAGRLMPEKGQTVLIEAVRRLAASGRRLRVEILGDGPARPALARQIAAAGLEDDVALRGWRGHDEVMADFARADVVVIPSDGSQESFGLVLAEAMAVAGRIVASDIDAFTEVVAGLELANPPAGVTVFPRGDPAGLAAALIRALSEQPDATRLAHRRRAAVERYDLRRMARIYLALYGVAHGATSSIGDEPSLPSADTAPER
jgi:glycosyltransferase involved in cell wall biosynthesis